MYIFLHRGAEKSQPSPTCNIACRGGIVKEYTPDCVCIPSFLNDVPSLPKPKQKLFLLDFTQDYNTQLRWCTPTFYAYVYIDIANKKVSHMSDWTTTPVVSGGENLPTLPGVDLGDTCNFNRPVVGILDREYDSHTILGYVFRRSATSEPVPAGYMLPGAQGGMRFVDLIQNARHFQRGNGPCRGCGR